MNKSLFQKPFRNSLFKQLALVSMAILLASCGGGGGGSSDDPTNGTAEGLWRGTTDTERTIAGLVLDDGSYWYIYSAIGNSSVLGGVVQGTSTSDKGTITSSDCKDFNAEGLGIIDCSMAGSYKSKQSFTGTITNSFGQTKFTSSYDSSYLTASSLAIDSGLYQGTVSSLNIDASQDSFAPETFAISGDGKFYARGRGLCHYIGSIAPRPNVSVLNISNYSALDPQFSGCETNLSGVGYRSLSDSSFTGFLINKDRTVGLLYIGQPSGEVHSLGGTISGLPDNSVDQDIQLTVRYPAGDVNGNSIFDSEDLLVNKNGTFTFHMPVPGGFSYEIDTPPVNSPGVTFRCDVTNGSSGTMLGSDITSILVTCTPIA